MGYLNHHPDQSSSGTEKKFGVYFFKCIAAAVHGGIFIKGSDKEGIIILLPEGLFVPSAALGAHLLFNPDFSFSQFGIDLFNQGGIGRTASD